MSMIRQKLMTTRELINLLDELLLKNRHDLRRLVTEIESLRDLLAQAYHAQGIKL
jgi:hypothetical protein